MSRTVLQLNVYQYNHPSYSQADPRGTKWIAAPGEKWADARARARGWKRCGGMVFTPAQHQCKDLRELVVFGVDEVAHAPVCQL